MENFFIKQWNDQVNGKSKDKASQKIASVEQIISPGSVQVLNDENNINQQAKEVNNLHNALLNAGLI